LNQAIQRLQSIKSAQLGAIILVPKLDIQEVTDIFVRINSQGKRLNESDFAMSKIASDEKYGGNLLRKAIDYFCHLAIAPQFYEAIEKHDKDFSKSEFMQKIKWLKDENEDLYDPDYNDVLRVSFMHQFKRGRLSDLVSLISGRDFADRTYKESIAEDSFNKLKAGVLNFINEFHFKEFILLVRSIGFISPKLLTSKLTLDFAYMLYLLLREDKVLTVPELKRHTQKWFVLSTLTSRYIGSPESQFDRDIREIESKGFITFFKENENSILSENFWNVTVPRNLETSSGVNPQYSIYLAAQIFFNDSSLLSSSSKVRDLVEVAGDVHHIFPKEYLKQNGIIDRQLYNQVANYAYLDTNVNITIGKKAPHEYFALAHEQCHTKTIKIGSILDESVFLDNLRVNCIPPHVEQMNASDYNEFLKERRKMMAKKIKAFYESI